MVQVALGTHDPAQQACNSDVDCATPAVQNWPRSVVTTVVTDTFEASHPAEADMMRNLSFTNAMMNGLLAWQDENKATGDEAAGTIFPPAPSFVPAPPGSPGLPCSFFSLAVAKFGGRLRRCLNSHSHSHTHRLTRTLAVI